MYLYHPHEQTYYNNGNYDYRKHSQGIHGDGIITFKSDGNFLAVGSLENNVTYQLEASDMTKDVFDFDSDGNFLAVGSLENNVTYQLEASDMTKDVFDFDSDGAEAKDITVSESSENGNACFLLPQSLTAWSGTAAVLDTLPVTDGQI